MLSVQGFPEVIPLNVGGRHFDTTLSTLLKYEDSMLAAMFSGRHRVAMDKDGRYFIDRDGGLFGHILKFLRQDKMPPSKVVKDVLEEAEFYGLHQLSEKLKNSSVSVFLETVLRKQRADFREAHPKLASLTLDVIDEARRKFQENPTEQSSVAIWFLDPRSTMNSVSYGPPHDCSATEGCIIAEYIPHDVINEYVRYSSTRIQECGYKVDIESQRCRAYIKTGFMFQPRRSECGSHKTCFTFKWSLVDPALNFLFG
ncbi:uncharacterized protein [Branchiostoma lanceolatum]|uniref:uncharacterized protein n=1 Tax=Branchiostoma lanceolatum TaxID=7740 RepID=UPI003451D9C1